jgi:hypothetical protein
MLAVEVVGAVGDHDEQRLGPERVDHERQQLPGRAVRPVEVLQDQDDGPLGGEALQQPEEGLEQLRLAGRRRRGSAGSPGVAAHHHQRRALAFRLGEGGRRTARS